MKFSRGLLLAGFSLCLIFVADADVSEIVGRADPPVTDICLGCICQAISGCNRAEKCSGDTCGLFRITWAYWADGGKNVLNNEPIESQTAYSNCVTDPVCAARTVQGYMSKFGQDCNKDGVINCYDHAAIHLLGGYGCSNALPEKYTNTLKQCLTQASAFQG